MGEGERREEGRVMEERGRNEGEKGRRGEGRSGEKGGREEHCCCNICTVLAG